MNAKQYLKQAYRLNELIESNKQELEDLNLLSSSLPGIDYSKDRVQTSSSGNAGYTNIVDKIVDLEKAIKADIEKLLSLKLEIRTVINEVQDNEQKAVLKLRYLNFMIWDNVAAEIGVSRRTVIRIHDAAIQNVVVPES
jgi:DNA-directed RNA polymerase specialized sigma subunit